jgi:hypothetical protein
MKPTFQFSGTPGRATLLASRGRARSLRTDYHFQAGSGDFSSGGHGHPLPKFRRLSEDYFAGEARSHFAIEAAVFGLILLTAAVPVLESVQALVRFVYGAL